MTLHLEQCHQNWLTMMVRVVIQNFLKKPVISTVFKADEWQITCIYPLFGRLFFRQPPFFYTQIQVL